MAAGSLRVFWQAAGFAEVAEQATDAVGGALMAVGFAFPAAFLRANAELCFTPASASWANPIEAPSGPVRTFVMGG